MEFSGSPATRRRILALWFPRLSTDRFQRRWQRDAAPPPDSPPLVTVEKADNALRVASVDRKATALGLSAGLPLANARAMLPSLKVMVANEAADTLLLTRIANWCDRFTPFVALDPPRALLLDVTGASHLFVGEAAMLHDIRARLQRQGFAVRGAIAATAMAARACARYRDGAVVAEGMDAAALAGLPVEALLLDEVTTHAFRRAGLKTIGQVAGRDRRELVARFGAEMIFRLEQALGHAEKPITPRMPLPDYSATQNFSEPVVAEETVRATLVSLAETLCAMLEQRGEGARRWEAAFFRADGAVMRIAVETGAAVRDAQILARLFRDRLDALADPLDPGFGFDLIRLSASRTQRCEAQAADFDSEANAEKAIRFLVDRLSARFGAHRVLAFRPNDTHIPEAAWTAVPAQYARADNTPWTAISRARETPRRPLRLFAKSEPVEALAGMPADPPKRFRWRTALHEVVHVEGPERIAMEWWRHQAPQPTRDYYRAEDKNGLRFWLYRDGINDREVATAPWFLHGLFA